MAVVLIFLIAVIFILCVVLIFIQKTLEPTVPLKGTTNIPGPIEGFTWPLIGDGLWFSGCKDMTDMWIIAQKMISMRDRAMSSWVGKKLLILIKDPKLIDAVMGSNKCMLKDADFYQSFQKATTGVFSSNGKRWSDARRPLDKLLHVKKNDQYFDIFVDKAKVLCDVLDRCCGKGVFDINSKMTYCTLDITLETLMGVPGNEQILDLYKLPKNIYRLVELMFMRAVKLQFKSDWLFNFFYEGKHWKRLKQELRQSLGKIVKSAYEKYEQTGSGPDDADFVPDCFTDIVVQNAIRDKTPVGDMETSLLDLIIAGFDTTSVTMSSACLFLAMHPEYQEKAYQEQMDILGDQERPPTMDEISKMDYLGMVINETLRLVAVPGVIRTMSSELEVDGMVFPEGASILMTLFIIRKDPKYWEKPEEFYPDHFLPEKVAKRPKAVFLPFFTGNRSCPGKIFARVSMKIVLSMLVRRFKFTTPLTFDQLQYQYNLMIEIMNGYNVEVSRRSAT